MSKSSVPNAASMLALGGKLPCPAVFAAAAALFSLLVSCPARAQTSPSPPSPPRIAIFDEPDFPYYNVPGTVTPEKIAADLHVAGLAVDLLDTAALADPARFSVARYAAVILPYGNTYPRDAFANLRAFHRGGGSLVTSGIPFTHPVARAANGSDWNDLGHNGDAALFGPDGIGMGGFAGPGGGATPFLSLPDDPFRLSALIARMPKGPSQPSQWLDRKTLPEGVRVIPAVGTAGHPLVALLVHDGGGGDAFHGAVDAWCYSAPDSEWAPFLDRQLIERGTIAALAQRGLNVDQTAAYAALDAQPRPTIYANLVLPDPPRPYTTFQPKLPPPARHLYVADVQHLTRDERILFASLQGIVNRRQPRIYLITDDADRFWLEEMQRQDATDAPIPVADPWTLLDTFKDEVAGPVICDPNVYESPCIAASLAGIADVVVCQTPELAARVPSHRRVIDLRGLFKDDADALHYLRTQLLPHLNPYLACSLDPPVYERGAIDEVIAARGAFFWITGPKSQKLPGANMDAELEQIRALFADMPLGAVVRGFWWHGTDVGLSEDAGVALGSRFGKITLVSDLITNLSVHSGIPADHLVQKPRPPAPKLDRSKVYLAFTMSDGDNLCTWRDYFRRYFNDPVRGTFPVGWGMGPSLIDLAPDWARWYYAHATPNDEFLCDVSGVAYIYPPSWATSLKDRNAALRYFYGRTAEYMGRMDMKTVRLMNVGADDIAQVGPLLPGVEFLVPDYGHAGGENYADLTYTLPSTGQAVFRAATSGKGPENLADQIRRRAGANRPAFLNAFIWNWGSNLSDLKKVLDLLGPEYVAVTPSQLNTLYREAK